MLPVSAQRRLVFRIAVSLFLSLACNGPAQGKGFLTIRRENLFPAFMPLFAVKKAEMILCVILHLQRLCALHGARVGKVKF